MIDNNKTQTVQDKWPDYLIQWRTSLWVSIREKESNVWKFVTFYGAAISLIIGLGQKLVTTLDLAIDITIGAALVGLLTFWGLAIVIDSNSWMSRNLKLVGNIEKIFIPITEYGKLIPGYYSSPFFKYFRPYTVDFSLLSSLGLIAYWNFLFHFTVSDQDWRIHFLSIITFLYIIGFFFTQRLDRSTRDEYLEFFENAKGNAIGLGAERFPSQFLALRLESAAIFYRWASAGMTLVIISYAIKEWLRDSRQWLWWFIVLPLIAEGLYLAISRLLSNRLKSIERSHKSEQTIDADALGKTRLLGISLMTIESGFGWFVIVLNYSLAGSGLLLLVLSNWKQLKMVFGIIS